MMPLTLQQGAYIVAGLLFILALSGLSKHETARSGNRFGVAGMAIALVMHRTIFGRGTIRTVVLIPYGIVTVAAAFS